ncbi:MAG: glutathione-regulated potassium-efflux system protein KefB [Alphaproteobacteria bacterium]|nr:glutathione-regulated potassium-efflux system protein KefB [Alphaproteobacteria bacterium]
MTDNSLIEVALFLAASVFAAPLARRLGIGSVLGYLLAGVVIGPFGLGLIYSVYQVETILHFAQFGVVLLLFIIGLEVRPKRLKTMRGPVFGLGSAQVAVTGAVLAGVALATGQPLPTALLIGLTLALSSTAFALQVLEEQKELTTRHGRTAFSILLFQDLAAIPLIALLPIFAAGSGAAATMSAWGAVKAVAYIALVVLGGRLLLNRVFPLVARSGVREAMTAAALLTVVAAAILMELGGLTAGLGAFIAGALLSESDYRHELEADIAPFEGLLLGVFFTAIGMSLDLSLLLREPLLVLSAVVALLALKAAILYLVGRAGGLGDRPSRRLALAISQGGEFAFVILTAATAERIVPAETAGLLSVVVTLSMVATPLLLRLDALMVPPPVRQPEFDAMPEPDPGFVVIAGLGRFGQIVARVLRARHIPFTALDASAEHVDFVRRFGNQIYYGDASRPEILHAARVGEARAFVLAVDDQEAALHIAQLVRSLYPHVPVYARARDRRHAHQLMDLEPAVIRRETFHSALKLTEDLLLGLGLKPAEADRAIETFQRHDEQRLLNDYELAGDLERLQQRARKDAEELERLFSADAAEFAPVEELPDSR